MPEVTIAPDGKKTKVLVNGIQRGVAYSSEELAESEANKIREQYTKVRGIVN
jgi:hypothetical protein